MKDIIIIDDSKYMTNFTKKYINKKVYSFKETTDVRAFIPGLIHDIYVKPGQKVNADTPLISLEAMKMYNDISVSFDIIVQDITVSIGDTVEKNQILITFKKYVKPVKKKPGK